MSNREIKFRAWDEGLAEMLPFDLQNISDNLDHQCLSEYVEGGRVMQYTGLKDKNGKEIYEADILGEYSLTGDFARDYEPTGKVYFDTDLSAYCVECTNGGWEYLHKYLDENKKTRIIGDIYSTPHLLKP